ncbi:DUF1918 domain-containing protein [Kibdelosporangium philippinense]|uniref:DUF1918 domain-containing protein n=1 Tax=Kibdelosporangium philippinense TaxID=211113 RepID=A0ABS8ZD63_9PSEU|nr:DUF1918 domain-containing protein [Kibdelosporangium philippinense]MCE7004616.1 DUF1918 domain-containing protein [Kibdelosporangium philippinense]
MRANVADWLVVKGAKLDDVTRKGEIVQLVHEDGAPPFYVHWLDTDRVTLVFPGPDAHVERHSAEPSAPAV